MASSIRYIDDQNGDHVFPVTHERAVRDSDGVTLETKLGQKQDTLVSGTSIKTINSTSLLGSGNVSVQPTLVSGTNIKTVNGTSLLGSGNLVVASQVDVDSTPTSGSANAVSSGGVYTALEGKQATISTVNVTVDSNTGTPSGTGSVSGSTLSLSFSNLKGEGFAGVSSSQDGTMTITLTNGDTVTVDLNHNHPQYLKYVLLADEAAYTALTTKDSTTLYLIPE